MSGPAAEVLASSQIGTLSEFFVIALVLVSPYAFLRVRAVRRERARIAALSAPPPPEPEPDDQADDLARAVARIANDAAARSTGDVFTVTVPLEATLGGRAPDRMIVEQIVADGLRRDGIEILERDGAEWRCRRAPKPQQ